MWYLKPKERLRLIASGMQLHRPQSGGRYRLTARGLQTQRTATVIEQPFNSVVKRFKAKR